MGDGSYMKNLFKEFIEKETTDKDICRNYKDYPYTVQQMCKKIQKLKFFVFFLKKSIDKLVQIV